MKFKILIFFVISFIFISCKQKEKEGVLNLYGCYEANVYKVTGNNRFIRFNNNIEVYFYISQNNQEYRGKFIINPPLFAEAYTPFKKGDVVVLKIYNKLKNNNFSEMYLLERSVNNWKAIYTLKDVCSGNFSKEISQRKALFSRGEVKIDVL